MGTVFNEQNQVRMSSLHGRWREEPPPDTERDTELARLKQENARLLEENEMLKETFFKAGGIP